MPNITRRAVGAGLLAAATLRPARAAARDSVTIRLPRDVRGLDPANRTSFIEANVIKACTQRLVAPTRGTFTNVPDAAARIERATPTRISFELKPGQAFSGGYGPLTADDVKFSYERFATAGPGGKPALYAKDWDGLDGVEVTGPLTGEIHLKNPAPNVWAQTLAGGSGTIVSRRAFEALGDKVTRQLVGSGPYTIAEWEPNERMVLKLNPDWKGPAPGFPTVVLRPIADPKTAQLALRSGEVDFTTIDPGAAKELAAAGARVITLDSINYVWMGMNVDAPLLRDIRVRRAIRLSIDVDQAVLAAYNGAAKPIRALQGKGVLGNWPDAPTYGRDIAAARALLSEAGVAPGTKLRLTLLSTPAYNALGLVIRAMLAEAGLDVQIDARPAATFWSSGEGEDGKALELSLQRFGGQPDPSFQTQWFLSSQIGHWNWERWNSPAFDRLDAEARSTNDEAARAAAYIEMQKLMDQSAAFVWLTNEANVFAAAAWLDPAIQPTGDDLQYPLFRPLA